MEEKIAETTTKEKKQRAGSSNKGLLVIVALIVLIGLGAWFGRGMFGTASAAVVNGEVITRAEYDSRVEQITKQYELQLLMGGGAGSLDDPETQAQIRSVAIDELVNEKLFLQAAREAGIEVGDAEAEEELRLQRGSYPDEASYQADLAAAGVTENELKQNIRNQLTIIAYARSVIPEEEYTVTEAELQEVYNLNFAEASAGGEESESEVPTFEEFSSTNREQFELQKLGVSVGPLIEELRANADIKILVALPEAAPQQQTTQEIAPQDGARGQGLENVPVVEVESAETVTPEEGGTEE
ncbi:MAG: SurA N-terminal domain-containing protein [Candidatus Paceibacterota bacterium]